MKMGYIHLDGNRLNFAPENLMSVTIKELRLFHQREEQRLHPQLTKLALLDIRLEELVKQKIMEVADE